MTAMACGTCGGNTRQSDYQVTYRDGSTKVFTAAQGGFSAARVEAGKNPGATIKAVTPK